MHNAITLSPHSAKLMHTTPSTPMHTHKTYICVHTHWYTQCLLHTDTLKPQVYHFHTCFESIAMKLPWRPDKHCTVLVCCETPWFCGQSVWECPGSSFLHHGPLPAHRKPAVSTYCGTTQVHSNQWNTRYINRKASFVFLYEVKTCCSLALILLKCTMQIRTCQHLPVPQPLHLTHKYDCDPVNLQYIQLWGGGGGYCAGEKVCVNVNMHCVFSTVIYVLKDW